MSIRKIPFVEGEYYHIYNRGNSKQKIFLDNEDYIRFIKLLHLCNSKGRVNFKEDIIEKKIDAWDFEKGENIVSIGAWVLMPNHFHLYITISQGLALGDCNMISIFMQKVSTSYTMYFNKKYNRTGSLFEGKFKAVHISDDGQAKYLFSYIHLNPIKLIDPTWKEKGIQDINKSLDFLSEYKWSSYKDYRGVERKENKILNIKDFLSYFSDLKDFDKDIFEWLDHKNQKLK